MQVSRLPNMQERALGFIDAHREALVALASRFVATPSPNPPGDEKAMAEVARGHLAGLGFTDVDVVGPSPERANVVCRYHTGRPGRTLLLNGHLDTKPPVPQDDWETNPFQGVVRDGRLYGLGAADMKAADAALIYGLAAAVEAGASEMAGQVVLVLTADEEGPSEAGALFILQETGLRADAALIAEPSGIERSWDTFPLISRGISCTRFTVLGTQVHSAISDRVPTVNASLEASRLLLFLEEGLKLNYNPTPLCLGGPTINLGATLRAGEAYAMVSGRAEFTVDIRTLPGMSQAQLAEDIEEAVATFRRSYPAAEVSWEFFSGPLAWTEPTRIASDDPLVDAVGNAARQVLGRTPPFGYCPGGTEATWWSGEADIPTIPAFGPGTLAHCSEVVSCIARCTLHLPQGSSKRIGL